jgi:hypothetical protein
MPRSSLARALPLLALVAAGCGSNSTPAIGPWSDNFSNGQGQASATLAVDPSGAVALAGSFIGTLDLGGGAFPDSDPNGYYYTNNLFVGLLDAHGKHVWSAATGDENDQLARAVAFDPTGNVITTGDFYGSVQFGNESFTAQNQDGFLVALAPKGSPLWAKQLTSEKGGGFTSGRAVAASSDGTIAVGGSFMGSVVIDGDTVVGSGDGAMTSFVAKLDGTGKKLWAQGFGGFGHLVDALAFDDSDNLLVAGWNGGKLHIGGADFDTEPGYQGSIYAAKLDPDGNPIWAFQLGGPNSRVSSITFDRSTGNVILAGSWQAKIGAGDLGVKADSYYQNNGFVLAVSADGVPQWLKAYQNTNDVIATVSEAGYVVVAGAYTGMPDFGGGKLPDHSYDGLFVSILDETGEHVRTQTYGKRDQPARPRAIAASGDDVVISGTFDYELDLGGTKLTADSYNQLFVARLTP